MGSLRDLYNATHPHLTLRDNLSSTGPILDHSLLESVGGDPGGHDPGGDLPSRTELYLVMGLLTFLSIVGTAGNALVLYVFSQKKDRMTSTLFILGLAFVDFTTCLVVIPYTIYIEFVDFHISYDILCKLYQFLITCNIPFSALIMVAIAIDRYFCICHPFLHAINLRRAKLMIGCLGALAAGIGVIVGLMYGVYQRVDAERSLDPNGTALLNTTGNHLGVGAGLGSPASDGMSDIENAQRMIFNGSKPENNQVQRVYTGYCTQNEFVLSSNFAWYFQKCYTGMYLICLIIVIILYILIYRSVLARRTKRQKAKSKSLPLTVATGNDNNGNSQEETLLTTVNGDMATTTTIAPGSNTPPNAAGASGADGVVEIQVGNIPTAVVEVRNGQNFKIVPGKVAKKKKDDDEEKRRKSTKRDHNRSANLRTAAMLFVVTAVFVVTFLPAFLMALQLVPYSMTIFYMYFANNVANPVIYGFMNKNFRDDLKKLFCRR